VRSMPAWFVRGRGPGLALAIVLSSTVVGVAGCASVRSGLGTSSSVCFRAIPVGREAVADKDAGGTGDSGSATTDMASARSTTSTSRTSSRTTSRMSTTTTTTPYKPVTPVFVGVRSASQKDIDKFGSAHNYLKTVLSERNGGPVKGICLVAFRGDFDPNLVSDLLGTVPPPGHRIYAVVVVSEPSNKLLATFIRSKEPISFTHYVVGGG